MIAPVVGSAVFACAGWAGAHAGAALCAGRTPFADGPRPVTVPPWAFAGIGAALGAIAALHTAAPLALAVGALLAATLAAAAVADLRCGLLPDACTLVPLALVAAASVARGTAPAVIGGAAVPALLFAAAARASRGRGMGWGDVKLAALAGALVGALEATLVLFAACAAAAVAALATRRLREPVALGPYLAGALALALAFDPSLLPE